MNTLRLMCCLISLMFTCSPSGAYTLTFDDVPAGHVSRDLYGPEYGAWDAGDFIVLDHSNSTWGRPHSGNNVLGVSNVVNGAGVLKFSYPAMNYNVRTLSGYFSTQQDVQIAVKGHSSYSSEETIDTVIGGAGIALENVYLEIPISAAGATFIEFTGLNLPSELLGFCVDDLTITPVPEPSSLAALTLGLTPLGIAGLRKMKR
ncbi:MAG: PEP-CTERM sorting domain-containing protein [Armatimonadota bacterium]